MFKALFVAAVAAALIALPAYGSSSAVKLTGETGPGFHIDVEKAGKDLKTIKAGTYKIKVEDKSSIHNFHLFGPGVSKKTGVDFVGSRTWKVTLRVGTYKFRCDVHPKMMRGSFMVS